MKRNGNKLHEIVIRKIQERKEHMEHSDESTDFITAYLREVGKSEGKLEDRYLFNVKKKQSWFNYEGRL